MEDEKKVKECESLEVEKLPETIFGICLGVMLQICDRLDNKNSHKPDTSKRGAEILLCEVLSESLYPGYSELLNPKTFQNQIPSQMYLIPIYLISKSRWGR